MSKFRDKIKELPWSEIIKILQGAWEIAPEVWANFKKQGEKLPWRKEVVKIIDEQNKEIVTLKEASVRQDAEIATLKEASLRQDIEIRNLKSILVSSTTAAKKTEK